MPDNFGLFASALQVYFYRPSWTFQLAFAIFKLWVDPVTRNKFVLVPEGQEALLLEEIAPEQLPAEFHGQTNGVPCGPMGRPLEGDVFVLDAAYLYDRDAPLPPLPQPNFKPRADASTRHVPVRASAREGGAAITRDSAKDSDIIVARAYGRMELVVTQPSAPAPGELLEVVWPLAGFVALENVRIEEEVGSESDRGHGS